MGLILVFSVLLDTKLQDGARQGGEGGPRVSFLEITNSEKTSGTIHESLGNNIQILTCSHGQSEIISHILVTSIGEGVFEGPGPGTGKVPDQGKGQGECECQS